MTDLTRPFALLMIMALAAPALAQTAGEAPAEGTATEAPAEPPAEAPAEGQPEDDGEATPGAEFSTGQEVGAEGTGPGSTYTRETFGDWQFNCIRVTEGAEPCQLYQLLRDGDNAVAEISLTALPEGGEAVAGATIITPLETLLTEQLMLTVDGGKSKRYPFTFCAAIGCISRVGFTAEDLEAFRRGASATLTLVPVAAPDQKVNATISLNGFTAGYDAVAAYVAENRPPPAEE